MPFYYGWHICYCLWLKNTLLRTWRDWWWIKSKLNRSKGVKPKNYTKEFWGRERESNSLNFSSKYNVLKNRGEEREREKKKNVNHFQFPCKYQAWNVWDDINHQEDEEEKEIFRIYCNKSIIILLSIFVPLKKSIQELFMQIVTLIMLHYSFLTKFRTVFFFQTNET